MKHKIIPGIYTLLATAFALLLAASIFFSCRGGGDPHHTGSSAALESPPTQTSPATVPPAPTSDQAVSLIRQL